MTELSASASEAVWQRTVVDTARAFGWLVYHTFDSRRSQPGFPDLVLVRDRVLFVELKSERGRLSQQQRAWMEALVGAGADCRVWRPSDWLGVVGALRPGDPRGATTRSSTPAG